MNLDTYLNNSANEEEIYINKVSWWALSSNCILLRANSLEYKARLLCEFCQFVGAIFYLLAALMEAKFLGYKMFIENLVIYYLYIYFIFFINLYNNLPFYISQSTAPSRVMFLMSCCIMTIIPWLRFSCVIEFEDYAVVILMLTTAPYFLFFCR